MFTITLAGMVWWYFAILLLAILGHLFMLGSAAYPRCQVRSRADDAWGIIVKAVLVACCLAALLT